MNTMYTCLFDIDGTLITSGGAGKAALEGALSAEFGIAEPADGVSFSGRTDRAIVGDFFAHHGIAPTEPNWRRLLEAYLRLLPETLAGHPGRVLPGIAALMQTLADRDDVALGLLTGNVRDGARLKLSHYGLFDHFLFGGFGDHHTDRNDVAHEALAAAKAHLNGRLHTDRVWVIGDTPLDIAAARAIGARAAAVLTGWHTPAELAAAEPDLLLEDLSDPEPLIAMWD
jgi:phosphoglycolate phosphatase